MTRKIDNGTRSKPGVRVLTDGEIARAADLQRRGATVAEIGRGLGVSAATASRALARAGTSRPLSARGRPRGGAGGAPTGFPVVAAVSASTAALEPDEPDERPSDDAGTVVLDALVEVFDSLDTLILFDADVELLANRGGEAVRLVGHLSATGDGSAWTPVPEGGS